MTREKARKAAEVMMAYAEGKQIEVCRRGHSLWCDFDGEPMFNWREFSYRVKKEPTYRPFKDKEECWNEMLKHQPFGWLKHKENRNLCVLTEICDNSCFDRLNKKYTFADDTPFGIKEERK